MKFGLLASPGDRYTPAFFVYGAVTLAQVVAPQAFSIPLMIKQSQPDRGNCSSKSWAYIRIESETCFALLVPLIWRALERAWANTGNRIAARKAIIAITTSSSMSVNPDRALQLLRCIGDLRHGN